MKSFYFKILIFLGLTLRGGMAWGQVPANDDCAGATNIANPRDFCGVYNNTGATPSGFGPGSCWANTGTDVWYKFTAVATEVNLRVFANSLSNPNLTLRGGVAVSLYFGDCSSINELRCSSQSDGNAELVRGGLIVGASYLIRVQGINNRVGTFQICINNYNPPSTIDGDCITAAVLCDKSPFTVQQLVGEGKVKDELRDAPCMAIPATQQNASTESSSVWFKWTAATSGTLTFTLTPNNLGDGVTNRGDDLDFVVYELTNGLNNCTGRRLLGCMAAGPYGSCGARCMGGTGLKEGETDVVEEAGCDCLVRHSNFIAPIQMVQGRSYALAVNNFSEGGNGFHIEWGGTGTFVGPQAKININKPDKKYCLGEDVLYSDASTFASGQITKRQWRFGQDASVDTALGTGPFRVFYKTPGWKAVVLTITTERGCVVTSILDSIYIEPLKYDSLLRRPTCTGGSDGMIRLKVVNCGRPPIRYNWENTGYTTRDSIANLTPGSYRVAVTDSSGKYIDTIRFTLKPFEVELDTAKRIVFPPLCNGQTNGKIELNPVTGLAPFRYKWNNNTNFIADNTLTNLPEGQYTVEIRDAQNCRGNYSFDITAPPPVAVNIDTINISCFGRADGMAIANTSGGVGKYTVNWSNGSVGDTLRNLRAGTYNVAVKDGNDCPAQSSVLITEPTQILLTPLSITPAKCFGDSSAALAVTGRGGTPPYRYSLDGVRFQRDTLFRNIPAKSYDIVVRDSTGCRTTTQVIVPQPPQLKVNAGPDIEVQLGFNKDLSTSVTPSASAVLYTWTPSDSTLSCTNCPRPTVKPLRNTVYKITIRDSTGCTAFDELLVEVLKIRPIFIPNAFSPNNDGVNDFLTVYGNQSAVIVKDLRVYNRWGGIVFEGKNLPLNTEIQGWDGTFKGQQMPPGVFAFYAIVSFIDGEDVIYKGDVTLLR
jgi:gliding motility-associated-like protein